MKALVFSISFAGIASLLPVVAQAEGQKDPGNELVQNTNSAKDLKKLPPAVPPPTDPMGGTSVNVEHQSRGNSDFNEIKVRHVFPNGLTLSVEHSRFDESFMETLPDGTSSGDVDVRGLLVGVGKTFSLDDTTSLLLDTGVLHRRLTVSGTFTPKMGSKVTFGQEDEFTQPFTRYILEHQPTEFLTLYSEGVLSARSSVKVGTSLNIPMAFGFAEFEANPDVDTTRGDFYLRVPKESISPIGGFEWDGSEYFSPRIGVRAQFDKMNGIVTTDFDGDLTVKLFGKL